MLAPDLSNLTVLCLRLGLPLESIAPERRPVQPSPMRGALPALTNGDLQQQAAAIAAAGICEAGADTAHSDKKEDAEAAGEECQAPNKQKLGSERDPLFGSTPEVNQFLSRVVAAGLFPAIQQAPAVAGASGGASAASGSANPSPVVALENAFRGIGRRLDAGPAIEATSAVASSKVPIVASGAVVATAHGSQPADDAEAAELAKLAQGK